MKRIICIFLIMLYLMCIPVIASALEMNNYSLGITYDISTDWSLNSNENVLSFYHKENTAEGIIIECLKNDGAYNINSINKDFLYMLCDQELYSNERLTKYLSNKYKDDFTVTTDAIKADYEIYNNVKYFRYEKAYTARFDGEVHSSYYSTVFITAKNGRIYFIQYNRDENVNHFKDVISLLNNISYKLGEIKIEFNGEIIECDAEPIMYNEKTMVPIRAVAEKMGYTVGWDADINMVILASEDNSIVYEYVIDSYEAVKNKTEIIKLEVPAILIGKKAYLPVRAVAEAMDAKVSWIEEENKVIIIK